MKGPKLRSRATILRLWDYSSKQPNKYCYDYSGSDGGSYTFYPEEGRASGILPDYPAPPRTDWELAAPVSPRGSALQSVRGRKPQGGAHRW